MTVMWFIASVILGVGALCMLVILWLIDRHDRLVKDNLEIITERRRHIAQETSDEWERHQQW